VGRKVQNVILGSHFWKNVAIYLRLVVPSMVVFRLLDSHIKPTMGFICDKMDCAQGKIKYKFNNTKKK